MLEFRKRKKMSPLAEAMTGHVIESQSILRSFFREGLGRDENDVREMELTYFAAAVMTFAFRRFAGESSAEQVLESFTRSVLKQSLTSSRERAPLEQIVREYEVRLGEYNALLPNLFNPDMSSPVDPATLLWQQFFGSVSPPSARLTTMMEDIAGTRFMLQFGVERSSFVKKVIVELRSQSFGDLSRQDSGLCRKGISLGALNWHA